MDGSYLLTPFRYIFSLFFLFLAFFFPSSFSLFNCRLGFLKPLFLNAESGNDPRFCLCAFCSCKKVFLNPYIILFYVFF